MLWMDRRSRSEGGRTGEGCFCVCEAAPYVASSCPRARCRGMELVKEREANEVNAQAASDLGTPADGDTAEEPS